MKNTKILERGDIIANYLVSNYKEIYQLKTVDCDQRKGQFADYNLFIDCHRDIRIHHYGNKILEAFIPNPTIGHDIINIIQTELGDNIIFHIEETDTEVTFRFNSKHMKELEQYLKPKHI